MKKEEGIDFRRAHSEPILYGINTSGTSRSGTCITTPGHPDAGFGSRKPSVSSSVDYPLTSSQKRIVHQVICLSDWRGFAYLSGQNSFFDQTFDTLASAHQETDHNTKTEPVSPMGDQPEVPNLNEGEDNAANPNIIEVNAEDVPANDGNNLAQAGAHCSREPKD